MAPFEDQSSEQPPAPHRNAHRATGGAPATTTRAACARAQKVERCAPALCVGCGGGEALLRSAAGGYNDPVAESGARRGRLQTRRPHARGCARVNVNAFFVSLCS